jgi:hypothetical protein
MTETKEFDRQLEVKFDHELGPEELRREQARRMAIEMGAIKGQEEALAAMKMRTV